MKYIILQKALVKVKVPVRLDSGKIVMGYRYKKTGDLSSSFQKKKKTLLRDIKTIDVYSSFGYLTTKNAIELKLLNPKDLKEEIAYIKDLTGTKERNKLRARLKSELKSISVRPSDEKLKRIGEKTIERSLKKLGFDKLYWCDFWANAAIKSRNWQDGWASHSNDHGDSTSDILQYAMSKRLPEGTYDLPPGVVRFIENFEDYSERDKEKEKEYNLLIKAADVVIDTVYSRIQSILKNMGYNPEDSVFLYRGMRNEKAVRKLKSGKIYSFKSFKSNPLSSWSVNPETARGFGVKLLVTKVKVKDIFSIYLTGLGCASESEVILTSASMGYFKVFAKPPISASSIFESTLK